MNGHWLADLPQHLPKPPRATRRSISRVLELVRWERYAQVAKWGDDLTNDHPDGTGLFSDRQYAREAQEFTDWLAQVPGRVTWRAILHEEVREAFAESDPDKLRAELLQVAAVAVKWVESIDRRADQ